MKSKRGQFFLIMAVAIGALLLGATALFNQARTQDVALESFNLACENYYYEVQELNKECLGGSDFKTNLQDFTNHFLDKNPGIGIVYLYGNNETGVVVYTNREVELKNPEPITNVLSINIFGKEKKFTFHDYNEFHFIMKQTKGLEVYFCEK